jgi:hypothetical protein
MKHLKPFKEAKESKEDIEELIRTCLIDMIDDNFKIEIYKVSKKSYNINIDKSKAFDWSDVADSIVTMIEYLKTKGFKVEDDRLYIRCWRKTSSFDSGILNPTIKELDDTQIKKILYLRVTLIEL